MKKKSRELGLVLIHAPLSARVGIRLYVEFLVIVLDHVSKEGWCAPARCEFTATAEDQAMYIVRGSWIPRSKAWRVRISREQERLVPCLHLLNESCLCRGGVWCGTELDKAKLEKLCENKEYKGTYNNFDIVLVAYDALLSTE